MKTSLPTFKCLVLLMALAGTASFSAQAEIKTAKSGNWNDPTDWTPVGVPAAGDYIIIPAGVIMNYNADLGITYTNVIEVKSGGTLSISINKTLNMSSTGRVDIQAGGQLIGVVGSKIIIGGTPAYSFAPLNAERFGPQTCNVNGCNQPLPVELTYFRALNDNGTVRLQWATASEQNSRYFAIERSPDALTFGEIARRDAAGNSKETIRYEILDDRPLPGTTYYRLRQVDTDGSQHLYRAVSVSLRGSGEARLLIFPNPSDGRQLMVRVPEAQAATVSLQTISGAALSFFQTKSATDELALTPSQPLAPGIYLLSVKTNDRIQSQKVVVR